LNREESCRFNGATLVDSNANLINFYQVVRAFPGPFMQRLRELEEEYEQAPEKTYAEWRSKPLRDPLLKAAQFLLINKAGFNGLYRVNKRGVCNVPWGKRAKVSLFEEENLIACSKALEPVHLGQGDFASVLDWAKAEDLVYFDPPYTPVSVTACFTGYTAEGFSPDDHHRLALTFRELHQRGVYVVLSQADTPDVRELYQDFDIQVVSAKRNVNSRGDKRGPVDEVLVCSRLVPRPSEVPAVSRQCPVCGRMPMTWLCPEECNSLLPT
jgi:DNA adenine methylase